MSESHNCLLLLYLFSPHLHIPDTITHFSTDTTAQGSRYLGSNLAKCVTSAVH